MSLPDNVNARLADLTRILVTEDTLETSLHRLAQAAVAVVPSCDACSISLANGRERARTTASTSPIARVVDEVQYTHGHGPCLEAIEARQPIEVPDMASDDRWPSFSRNAAGQGVQSSYSLPLTVGTRTVGALNMYSTAGRFTDSSMALSGVFAAQAAVVLANAEAYQQARDLIGHLEEALKSRDVIGQAKGIIMERLRCTAEQAFDVLRSASQARNVKLREVAEGVVRTGSWEDVSAG